MSPSKFRLRKIFRRPVMIVASPFIKRGVHPNTITYLSLLFAYLSLITLLLTQNQLIYGVLVFLVGFFDGVDGSVARGTGKSSAKGAFTDSFVDKASEALILLAIPLAFPMTFFLGLSLEIWAFLCLTGWLLTSYARSRADALGLDDLDVGLGARSERLFILCVFSVLFLIELGLVIVTTVGICTALYRFIHYRNQILE
ncbi:MAG: CDP-alcohol phosphatidyltransferase family protein [Candidatus Thorarchaeota archaeon]